MTELEQPKAREHYCVICKDTGWIETEQGTIHCTCLGIGKKGVSHGDRKRA